MDKDMFNDIVDSLKETIEIAKGTKKASRTFKYKEVDVKKIRDNAHLSQTKFANAIGVSVKTVQNWEQGRRRPTGTARALLKVFEEKPKIVIEALHLKHV
jgi:putative transcriptional regulator